MEKKAANRSVKTYMDRNGILIFRLLQGQQRPRAIHTFGYGTRHGIWFRIQGLGSSTIEMTTEQAAAVKEKIAEWPM